jgi:hypothetical protein
MTEPQSPPAESTTAPSPAGAPVPALADVIARPARRSSRRGSLLIVLAGAIAVGGIAFAAGRLTAPAVTTAGRSGSGLLPGSGQATGDDQLPGSGQVPPDGMGPGRGGFGGMSVQGTVTEVTDEAITVELASGTTVTIPVDDDTAYRTASTASPAAVQVGSEVAITPGARTANSSASFDPGAAPAQGGGMTFGPASAVTVIEP